MMLNLNELSLAFPSFPRNQKSIGNQVIGFVEGIMRDNHRGKGSLVPLLASGARGRVQFPLILVLFPK